jgi:hypothetical protein
MSKRFAHLVWLGAGAATEPENLIGLAEQVTLFEAREEACLSLKKQYPTANIVVKQMVLASKGGTAEFTEYNLAEYSAVQAATGLKNLFPGIKLSKTAQVETIAITDAISGLELSSNNNLLVIDIADSNLALVDTLQKNDQLHYFNEIHIQAGNEPLYAEAATSVEIKNYLSKQGYFLQYTNSLDPDLPRLTFGLNPLWQEFQKIQQTLLAQQQINQSLSHELDRKTQELLTTAHENRVQMRTLEVQLENLGKQSSSRLAKIAQLEKQNRTLHESNEQLNKQHTSLKQQILNAEAQIEIIKELIID